MYLLDLYLFRGYRGTVFSFVSRFRPRLSNLSCVKSFVYKNGLVAESVGCAP